MYQVFNCGHRMEIYVPAEIANKPVLTDEQVLELAGYAKKIEKFDVNLGKVLEKLKEDDLLIITDAEYYKEIFVIMWHEHISKVRCQSSNSEKATCH